MPNFNVNSPDHPDDELIEDARMQASNDREEEFVADIKRLRNKLGLGFKLSADQRAWLQRIAYGDGPRW